MGNFSRGNFLGENFPVNQAFNFKILYQINSSAGLISSSNSTSSNAQFGQSLKIKCFSVRTMKRMIIPSLVYEINKKLISSFFQESRENIKYLIIEITPYENQYF